MIHLAVVEPVKFQFQMAQFSDAQNVIVYRTEHEMLTFSIDGNVGTITGSDIAVTIPGDLDIENLTATFSIDGNEVRIGSDVQSSGSTVNNFTDPVIYRVMAENGTWRDYTVTVTKSTWQHSLGGSEDDGINDVRPTNDGNYLIVGYKTEAGNKMAYAALVGRHGREIWSKTMGGNGVDEFTAFEIATNGNMIITGSTSSNDGIYSDNRGGSDIWFVEMIPADGTVVVDRRYGGSHNECGNSIIQNSDGDYVVAGHTFSNDGNFENLLASTNTNYSDFFAIKLSDGNDGAGVNYGDITWRHCYGGYYAYLLVKGGNEVCYRIRQTSDGGYILIGSSTTARYIGLVNGYPYAVSVVGNVTGHYGGSLNWNPAHSDVWVVKISSTGFFEWGDCIGGQLSDIGYDIHEVLDGSNNHDGFILLGETVSNNGGVTGNNGNYDAWVARIRLNGSYGLDIDWQQCYGGSGYDIGRKMISTSTGYVIAGSTSLDRSGAINYYNNFSFSNVWIVSIDFNGLKQWERNLGGSQNDVTSYRIIDHSNFMTSSRFYIYHSINGLGLSQTPDGGFIIGTTSASNDGDVTENSGGYDMWLLKLNPDGELIQ